MLWVSCWNHLKLRIGRSEPEELGSFQVAQVIASSARAPTLQEPPSLGEKTMLGPCPSVTNPYTQRIRQ